ncbi:MAG: hypothetical protein ACXWKH_13690 [Limisphaerales bacterium]
MKNFQVNKKHFLLMHTTHRGVRRSLAPVLWLCFAFLFGTSAVTFAQATGPQGLWVGEVTLNRVNETVVGINAQNQTVAPDPSVTTPVQSAAHLRIILHVDKQGQVRLLKNVALLNKSTNSTPDLALITDSTLYPNFSSVGKRIATAAYDFGDDRAVQVLDDIAAAAASAASTNGNPTNAAVQVAATADLDARYVGYVSGAGFNNAALNAALTAKIGALQAKGTNGNAAQVLSAATSAATNNFYIVTNRAYAQTLATNGAFVDSRYVAAVDSVALAAASGAASAASSNLTAAAVGASATNAALVAVTNAINAQTTESPNYRTFIGTSSFASAVNIAAAAASVAGKASLSGGSSATTARIQANGAAVKALTDANIYAAADTVVMNEALLSGTISPDQSLSGTIYLGASHPTNPFRHRRHPDHTIGYPITRALSMHFDSSSSTNAQQIAGFGVDQITGTYREEISGLHKPLGPSQNIGLITDGTVKLNRVSLVDTLNQ